MGQEGDDKSSVRAGPVGPTTPEPWIGLGDALARSGDAAGAAQAYLQSVELSVNQPQLVEAAGHLFKNRLAEAEGLLRARLTAFPTDVAALRMMGELAARRGHLDEALSLLRRTVELAPGFARARELLARLLGPQRPGEALVQVEALLGLEPDNLSHSLFKAALLARTGELEPARAIYEAILARTPGQPKIWLALGHILKTLGQQSKSIEAYRTAVRLAPSLGEAWWGLANLKTRALTEQDRAVMQAALRAAAGDEDRWHLHFALGRALEEDGQAQPSFAHYEAGNRLRRSGLAYSADDTEDQCRRLSRIRMSGLLEARQGAGCPAPDPIFILGMPRAGSTLVEQILSSHSLVEATMELPDMMAIAGRLRAEAGGGYPDSLAELPAERLRALGEEYIERTRPHRKTSRPFFIDKMPNNWQHVDLIQLILPMAKIIDVRRHPMACCLSGWTQHFARGQGFSYDLADLGRYYTDYACLMDAFDQASPGRVHRVIYERLVQDTEAEVRRLLDHLDLPFEAACLSFWETRRAVATPSSEQVRRPIFTSGLDHWRMYAPWLAPLEKIVGPLAAAYPEMPARG